MRSEPVVFLSLVENDLQGAYAYGQERKPDVVEPGEPLLSCGLGKVDLRQADRPVRVPGRQLER